MVVRENERVWPKYTLLTRYRTNRIRCTVVHTTQYAHSVTSLVSKTVYGYTRVSSTTVYAYFTIIFGISRLRDPVTAGCTARFIRISKHVATDYDASRWLTRDDAESQRRGAHTRICYYTLPRFAKLRSTTFENNVICPGNNEIWMRNWKITFQTKVTSK